MPKTVTDRCLQCTRHRHHTARSVRGNSPPSLLPNASLSPARGREGSGRLGNYRYHIPHTHAYSHPVTYSTTVQQYSKTPKRGTPPSGRSGVGRSAPLPSSHSEARLHAYAARRVRLLAPAACSSSSSSSSSSATISCGVGHACGQLRSHALTHIIQVKFPSHSVRTVDAIACPRLASPVTYRTPA